MSAFHTEAGRWLRYLYFMRFSLFLWFSPLLVFLNLTSAKTLTSGILVPDYLQGYLCVAFFLVSTGFVALISSRVVVLNGPVRFGNDENDAPDLLKTLLANDQGRWEGVVLFGSQLWNLFAFIYLYVNATAEAVPGWQVWVGLLGGAGLAFFFWYVANAWYYLNYQAPQKYKSEGGVQLGKNAARTILFPRYAFFPAYLWESVPIRLHLTSEQRASTPKYKWKPMNLAIENATVKHGRWSLQELLKKAANFLKGFIDLDGYREPSGDLFEAHIFSIVAIGAFGGLYLMIWPLSAPVPAVRASIAVLILTALVVIRIVWTFWKATDIGAGRFWWKALLTLGVAGFWVLLAGLYVLSSAERFPVFAVLLILAISACWILSGVAFFADRYRVPVLTVLLIAMVVPRLSFFHLVGDQEEHYFSTLPADPAVAQSSTAIPTPAEILDERWADPDDPHPLIIVTATGGGLHASAWTDAVLARLETEFNTTDSNGPAEPFHKHLLLLSTVSGGSTGLLYYMRELQESQPDFTRMQTSGQCSSLEAAGWGLVYYDLVKTFVPVLPYAIPPSSGDGDLDHSPLFKDRSWSLRKAFARNENNTYCQDIWKRDNNQPRPSPMRILFKDNEKNLASIEVLEKQLTLRQLRPSADFPAFTMNTTSVEQGNRFLLANYHVPHYPLDRNGVYPAQSFLDTFGQGKNPPPDLPLATAAQLSATFPYVSSATRVAKSIDGNSVHFVDGGYYDNDGTASAIEFLRFALAPSYLSSESAEEKAHLKNIEKKIESPHHPLRILWIEIRNSIDWDGGAGLSPGGNGAEAVPWDLFGQATAPLGTFWSAGHESVTGRNRVALGLFESAQHGKLEILRLVIADSTPALKNETDPLNWSLTPKQRKEVQSSADGMASNYALAKCWFSNWPWGKNKQRECTTEPAPDTIKPAN